ncbi:hypothetical protein [Streptomyces hirsutus]|uniref:hypothetical protein n=1 Tax=Streptomyces hirsutus TaxID=35620 RepID=UPI00331DA368
MHVVADMTEAAPVRPWPVASWIGVLNAYSPVGEPTEARLRTLRRNHVVSEGVQEAVHEAGGRLSGKVSLFCELNIDAAVLSRRGDSTSADLYRNASTALEGRLRQLLTDHRVRPAELVRPSEPRSRAAWHVLHTFSDAVTDARADLPPVPDEDVVPGVLAAQVGKWVRFLTGEGSSHYDLPWDMVRAAGLSIGDPAVFCRELLPNSNVILRLRAGLQLEPNNVLCASDEVANPLERRARQPVDPAMREALLKTLASDEPLVKRITG